MADAPMRITTTTSVADAGFDLVAERIGAAVVYRDGQPAGVVTIDDLAGHDGRTPLPAALVGDVMSYECVAIPPGSGVDATQRAYRAAAWDSLRRRHPHAAGTVARRKRSFLVFDRARARRAS